MTVLCCDLVAFADGELTPDRAAAFRAHLVTCSHCRSELVEHNQFTARLSDIGEADQSELATKIRLGVVRFGPPDES